MEQLPLFVFGTLRRGRCNHHYLANAYDRVVLARLREYARIAPLHIAPQANGTVEGELFFLKRDCYHETLRGCDSLEGIPPGTTRGEEYTRVRVLVQTAQGQRHAWAYVATHPEAETNHAGGLAD